MDFTNLPLLGALTRKMNWLTERQRVLSENIANANTPHYQSVDLRPLDFRKQLDETQARLQLVSTDPGHFTSGPNPPAVPADALVKAPEDRELSGNTVSVEDEMIKVSQTAADYQLMTNLYKKQIGLIKDAIGHGAAGGS